MYGNCLLLEKNRFATLEIIANLEIPISDSSSNPPLVASVYSLVVSGGKQYIVRST